MINTNLDMVTNSESARLVETACLSLFGNDGAAAKNGKHHRQLERLANHLNTRMPLQGLMDPDCVKLSCLYDYEREAFKKRRAALKDHGILTEMVTLRDMMSYENGTPIPRVIAVELANICRGDPPIDPKMLSEIADKTRRSVIIRAWMEHYGILSEAELGRQSGVRRESISRLVSTNNPNDDTNHKNMYAALLDFFQMYADHGDDYIDGAFPGSRVLEKWYKAFDSHNDPYYLLRILNTEPRKKEAFDHSILQTIKERKSSQQELAFLSGMSREELNRTLNGNSVTVYPLFHLARGLEKLEREQEKESTSKASAINQPAPAVISCTIAGVIRSAPSLEL